MHAERIASINYFCYCLFVFHIICVGMKFIRLRRLLRNRLLRFKAIYYRKVPLIGSVLGSVLGPLIFIVFINDVVNLCDDVNESDITLFADDLIIGFIC